MTDGLRLLDIAQMKADHVNNIGAEKWISKLSMDIEEMARKGKRYTTFHKRQLVRIDTYCFFIKIKRYENIPFEIINVILHKFKEEGFSVILCGNQDLLVCW